MLGILAIASSAGTTLALPNGVSVAASNTQITANWAGYDLPTAKPVTSVSASWIIPTLNCAITVNAVSNAWVGVGGFGSDAVYPFPQAGTDSDCDRGKQVNDYWCSKHSFRTNFSVLVGDKIEAKIWKSSGAWRCSVDDVTAQEQSIAALNYKYEGENRVADFVVERPTGSVSTLADFGTVQFANLRVSPRTASEGFSNQANTISMHETYQTSSPVLATVTLDPLIVHYTAKAAGSPGALSWSAPQRMDSGNTPTSVSCPSATYCDEVDVAGNISSFNGSNWTVVRTSGDLLNAVSCASVVYCAAVGYDGAGGNLFTYHGATWSSPQSLDVGYKLHSISCPTSSFCEVGAAVNVFTVDGTSESGPDPIDQSNNQTNESGYGLPSMSCTSSSFCATVDGSGNAFVMEGTTWSAPEDIDGTNQLDAVSCASSTFCIAVDVLGNAFTFNGSTWSSGNAVDPGTSLNSVSCSSITFCIAVDGKGDETAFNGTAWTTKQGIDSQSQLVAVSCASTAFCVAVDNKGNFVVGR